jgi:hypothetical protein
MSKTAYCDLFPYYLQFHSPDKIRKEKEDMSKSIKTVPKHRQTRTKHTRLPFPLILAGILILAGALFFAFLKPAAVYTPIVTGKPSLKIDKEKIDLGNMKLGDTAFASFQLTNVGDQVLQFTQAPTIQVIEGC